MKSACETRGEGLQADWEEQLTVGDRVLFWLLQHPYQRLEDVALAIGMHHSSAHRHLVQLTQKRLVESVKPTLGQTNTRLFYYLTQQGIERVARLLNTPPSQLARRWQVDESSLLRLLPRVYSLARLADLINGLILHAPAALG